MKSILVPTDFSECAERAKEVAFKLAKKTNAEIHFLHLMHTPVDWVKLPLEKEVFYPEVKLRIGAAKSKLSELKRASENLGIEAKTFLVYDKGEEEIDFHIKHHEHDFIVMGSHGVKGFKEIIGSNTQRIMRNSTVPVMVIKDEPNNVEFRNIVFASNFEEDVYEPFKKVVEFAQTFGSSIHLLYVNLPFHFKETDETEAEMKAFLNNYNGVEASLNIYNALNEERGIEKFSSKIGADLISMTTHGKTGFMKMISPSITESLANHSDIPVLSINMKNQ